MCEVNSADGCEKHGSVAETKQQNNVARTVQNCRSPHETGCGPRFSSTYDSAWISLMSLSVRKGDKRVESNQPPLPLLPCLFSSLSRSCIGFCCGACKGSASL